jgi:hypothetical protein
MVFEINTIGLFHCHSDSKPGTDTIQIIDKDELSEYETVNNITRQLVGKLEGKDFISKKSARIHEFTSKAHNPRDADANTTKDLLNSILERGDSVNRQIETLASWYLQTDYAQSGLLIVTHLTNGGRPQLSIIKAPFVDDAYEPDDNEVLTKMDQVIQGNLRKGILYPRITPSGEERKNQACVYQAESSQRFPKHWYEYLHLDPSKTSDEILAEEFDSEDENDPLVSTESTREFDEIEAEIADHAKGATVTIEIANKEVKMELGDLLEREDVHLIEDEAGYHLVISGDRPRIKFYDGSDGRFKELMSNLEEFDEFDTIRS